MAVAYVSDVQAQNDGASTITFSVTVAAGDDRVLLVNSHTECNSTPANLPITGITFNGDALTFVHAQGSPGEEDDRVEQWVLAAPDVGTFDCVVTYTGALDGCYVSAQSFTGVDQIDPIDVSGGSSNISTGPLSQGLTTTVDDCMIVEAVSTMSSSRVVAATAGQTEMYNEANAGQFKAGGSYELVGAAGAYTQTWSISSLGDWIIVASALKPAAEGGATTYPGYYGTGQGWS